MKFGDYGEGPVDVAVDLVNTSFTRVADIEAFLDDHCVHRSRVRAADIDEINVLGGRIREVFDAAVEGDDARVGRLLNALIVDADVRPEVTDHDGGWHLHYTPADAALLRRLTAVAAMALTGVVIAYGTERLKRCGADDCDDVFVDTSRNTSRRYCADRCSNRANVAAFRARKRAAGVGPPG